MPLVTKLFLLLALGAWLYFAPWVYALRELTP